MAKVTTTTVAKAKTKAKAVELKPEEIAVISTSDRSNFRGCRRRWNWSSHLRQGLHPLAQRHPLWFGSGMHHALEDLHGPELYASPFDAIDDYIQATIRFYGRENLPDSLDDDVILMKKILDHYMNGFLKTRTPYKTYKVGGVPQTEVPFEFTIPLHEDVLRASGYKRVIYRGIIDRIIIDEDGYLFLQDYKNVKSFTSAEHLELDAQIDAYLWAASYIYKRPVLGFIYTQLLKKAAEPPRILKDGSVSTDQSQATTLSLYRNALREVYGDVTWPEKCMNFLNYLSTLEEENSDKFVRRDIITRPLKTLEAAANKIVAEVSDMLDPDLRIYPNPSFMCPVMCSFIEPCLEMDRGDNYRTTLQQDYETREYEDRNEWRQYLKVGEKVEKPVIQVAAPDTKLPKFLQSKRK